VACFSFHLKPRLFPSTKLNVLESPEQAENQQAGDVPFFLRQDHASEEVPELTPTPPEGIAPSELFVEAAAQEEISMDSEPTFSAEMPKEVIDAADLLKSTILTEVVVRPSDALPRQQGQSCSSVFLPASTVDGILTYSHAICRIHSHLEISRRAWREMSSEAPLSPALYWGCSRDWTWLPNLAWALPFSRSLLEN
jgi:hypothetical protein